MTISINLFMSVMVGSFPAALLLLWVRSWGPDAPPPPTLSESELILWLGRFFGTWRLRPGEAGGPGTPGSWPISLPWQQGRLLNPWSTLRQPCRKTVGIQIRGKSTRGRVRSERWVGQIVRAKSTPDCFLSPLLFLSIFLLLLPERLITCFFSHWIAFFFFFFTLKPQWMIVRRAEEVNIRCGFLPLPLVQTPPL